MIDAQEWRNTMGNFATGVTVITTLDVAGEPLGMTANAFTSLSLDPPMVLICIDNNSSTLSSLLSSNKYCVNILASNQESISRQFAKKGGSEKFENMPYTKGEIGLPVIQGSLTSIECTLEEVFAGGDHKILLGKGIAIHKTSENEQPLVFFRGKYRQLEELEVSLT